MERGVINLVLNSYCTTFLDHRRILTEKNVDFVPDNKEENNMINLYPEEIGQTFEGFGGAFTDSAGYVYSLMDEDKQQDVIKTYFASDTMNYQFGRLPLDSCDFSLEQYEALSDSRDREMRSFSIDRACKYSLPFVEDVMRYTGKLIELMVSPWSPPAFMKTNYERCHGGELKDEYRQFWAEYICRYIKELKNAGFHIKRLSLQNEPAANQLWDSCVFSAEQEKVFLKNFMYPELQRTGLDDIELFIWDHNKERAYERACAIIDEETNSMIAGVAFHWYSGDHFEALELIRRRFPDKRLILSEACIEYKHYNANHYLLNAQKYAHDLIGNLNAGMNAFYDWNLILDENGGPNHANNLCDAPFLYDAQDGKLLERNSLHYIWHFSHFIHPGAVRIAFSKFTDRLEITAFKNMDGRIAVIILNRNKEYDIVNLRIGERIAKLKIDAESITSMII